MGWPGDESENVRDDPIPPAEALPVEVAAAGPVLLSRTVSAWSLTVLAAVGAGFALYAARELLQPIAAAFVIGVALSPAARKLEAVRVPRAIAAVLLVAAVALTIAVVIVAVVPRVSEVTEGLPNFLATWRDRLQALDSRFPPLRGVDSLKALFPTPSIAWIPSTIGVIGPPIEGFLLFLVVLLLFIDKWPDLRRDLVMTFASRDSRLTALRIVNDVEAGLGRYLRTVSLINLCLGGITAVICLVAGMPHAAGFGALAAALNFIPIIGPIANFCILLLVGVITIPDLVGGVIPAAAFALIVVVEGQFVTPAIVGRQLELNNLAVLLSLAFWAWLWGPIGAFLSSPILIVALILRERLSAD